MAEAHHTKPSNLPSAVDAAAIDAKAKDYNLSGKIMLTTIILLFFLILLMISLHLYARWYLTRARRRHHIRRNLRRRRANIVFFIDSPTTIGINRPTSVPRGLDAAILASLPVFIYESKARPENPPPDCAVCLSEFEPGEAGRVLPKCNHAFHTDCIDMWFHNHDTCPLCRAPVESQPVRETRPEVFITVPEPETGSSSGSCALAGENRAGNGTSKLSPVTIEVPARSGEGFRDESGRDSPSSFRSPVTRMLSFTRMLSRERRGSVSPSSGGCGGSGGCSSSAELNDAERGETRRDLVSQEPEQTRRVC